MPGNETRVVPIAHPFLKDAFAEILTEAAARCHQAVVAAVCLRKSADDSSGNQSTVRQHGQHHLHTSSHRTNPAKLAVGVSTHCWLANSLAGLEMWSAELQTPPPSTAATHSHTTPSAGRTAEPRGAHTAETNSQWSVASSAPQSR